MLRGVFGFLANIAATTSMRNISLAKATILIFMNPIFIGVFSSFILHERVSNYDSIGIVVTFIGVIVFMSNSL